MKKLSYIYLILITLVYTSCTKDSVDFEYTPGISISFTNVEESGIVELDKGATSYSAQINVSAQGTVISSFEIFQADSRSGARGNAIANTASYFEDGVATYTTQYTLGGLNDNKAIKIVVMDSTGGFYEKNLVLQITPAVLFSNVVKMETVENYYGPYFANWLSGRVYMRRHAEYSKEIDFSLGGVPSGTDTIPSLVNPSERGNLNLLTMGGLQATKFESTNITEAQFDAISKIDASPINALPDPTKDSTPIEKNKVYLYKTANGKKGLIKVSDLSKKTGTIELEPNKWMPNSSYHQVDIAVKTVLP